MEINRVSDNTVQFKVSAEELYRRWGVSTEDILSGNDNASELINQFATQAMQLLTEDKNVSSFFSVSTEYAKSEELLRIMVTKEKEYKERKVEQASTGELPFYTEEDILPDSIRTKSSTSADMKRKTQEYKESFLYIFGPFRDLVSACNQVKDDGIISHLIMEGECFALLLYAEDTAALKKAGLNLSEFAIKQYKVNDYEAVINKSDLLIKNTAISVICKEMS